MRFLTSAIVWLLYFTCSSSQDLVPGYHLEPGKKYFISQELSQSTSTEGELIGNVSLDIKSTLEMDVLSVDETGNYTLSCSYKDLELDFFSPRKDIAISSSNSAFSPVKACLKELEKKHFIVQMSQFGEFVLVNDLDSIINGLTIETMIVGEPEQQEMIRKTIREAFGVFAVLNTSNIALHVYGQNCLENCTMESRILFNARMVNITNNLYYSETDDPFFRIQGVGIIQETTTTIELNNYNLVTDLKGSQTYDMMFNNETGWITGGKSKQRIQAMSGLKGHDELPEGLKIPSLTETEFAFRGGELKEN